MDLAIGLVIVLGSGLTGLLAYELLSAWSGAKKLSLQAVGEQRGGPVAAGARSGEGHASARGPARLEPALKEVLGRFSVLVEDIAPLSEGDSRQVRERLRAAGVRMEPETWRCLRILICAGAGAIGFVAASLSGVGMLGGVVSCAVGVACAWGAAEWKLASGRSQRREAIEASLPDAMELLGVALAAGSPVEQCFREVAASLAGPLSEEFRIVDQDVNLLGRSRDDALKRLAQRCASQEVGAFVAQITQAINQGASVAEGLKAQAALSRERAQADALERIRKMPTKLDVVLSVCFLPPTVIVVLVPTVVKLLAFLQSSM